jgi:S1-C subfamily serine protease
VTVLDAVLLLAALLFAVSGYRQGFLVGVLSFAGFLGGATAGMVLAPGLVGGIDSGPLQVLAGVGIVLVAAALGQAVLGFLGARLRSVVTWTPARLLDSTAGAVVSVAALLVFCWFLATALREAPVTSLNREIGASKVLRGVDSAMPDDARGLFSSFRRLLDESALPRVFSGLSTEPVIPVDPPSDTAAATPGVREASDSVVKVEGSAQACRRRVEGSGFVYAPQRVLTNAHVVAGVDRPTVTVGGRGEELAARVVVFDPRRDLAVLYVEDLDAEPLAFDGTAARGDEAVVAGFPGGGPYWLEPARVRDRIEARGHDIYSQADVTRQVLSLYASVLPGNSGGPLLTPDGDVYGVIFAKSLDRDDTGYALTVAETRPVARAGRTAINAVDTQQCTSG